MLIFLLKLAYDFTEVMICIFSSGSRYKSAAGQQIPALQARNGQLHREPLRRCPVLQVNIRDGGKKRLLQIMILKTTVFLNRNWWKTSCSSRYVRSHRTFFVHLRFFSIVFLCKHGLDGRLWPLCSHLLRRLTNKMQRKFLRCQTSTFLKHETRALGICLKKIVIRAGKMRTS